MKKKVIVIGISVLVLVAVFFLMSVDLGGDTYPSVEELEASLLRGEEYDYARFDPTKKLTIRCDKCDKKEECYFVCSRSCFDNNMFLLGVLPLFGSELQKEGKCSCLCRSLSHINELIIIQSVKNNNSEECERIDVEITDFGVDNCYMTNAIFSQNESICEKIVLNNIMKNKCYFRVAVAKKDLDICSNIVGNEVPQENRTSCEEYVTGKKKAPFAIPE